MGAAASAGVQSHGVYVYTKHFALNDQETNRSGLSTWANEQAMRQIYLLPFELCVTKANAHGIMTGLNRIGAVWTSASYSLCTALLRGEWGCDGIVITDMYNESYMDRAAMLLAGTNLPINNGDNTLLAAYKSGYGAVGEAMRESAHLILYTVAHSNAMNGYTAGATQVISVTPTWLKAVFGADIVLGVLLALAVVWTICSYHKRSKKS